MTTPNRKRNFGWHTFSNFAYCGECRHSATLYLELREPALSIPDLRRRLRCEECGGRDAEIRVVYITEEKALI